MWIVAPFSTTVRLARQYVKRRASSEWQGIEKQFRSKGVLLQSHCSNTKHHGKCLSVFISFLTLLYLMHPCFFAQPCQAFLNGHNSGTISCFSPLLPGSVSNSASLFFHFVGESFALFSQKESLTCRARTLSQKDVKMGK